MPFVEMPGVIGMVYVPEKTSDALKKHPCADCKECQWCSDSRCALCRRSTGADEQKRCRRKSGHCRR